MDAFQSERLTSSLSVRPHERDGSQNWLFSPFSSSSRRMKLRGISTPLMIFLFSCRESDDDCVVYVFVFVFRKRTVCVKELFDKDEFLKTKEKSQSITPTKKKEEGKKRILSCYCFS